MKQLTLLALSVMLAGGAQAYTCSSSDGSLGTSDGQYEDDFIKTTGSLACVGQVEGNDAPVNVAVSLGSEIVAVQDVSLTFESTFSEAEWINEFGWDGEVRFNSGKIGEEDPFTESFTVTLLNGGVLPFYYNTNVDGLVQFTAKNGENEDNYTRGRPTFAFGYYEGYYYLGLNDNGIEDGANGDFDVDDFVVRFKVNADVPEPASAALLGLGVIGLGLSRLARRKV